MFGQRLILRVACGLAATVPGASGAQPLAVEVRGGVTHSRLLTDHWTPGRRQGAEVAIGIDRALRSWLGIRAGLEYSDGGAKGPFPFRMRIGYLSAPVSVRLAIPAAPFGLQPYVTAGVGLAREVHCGGSTAPFTIGPGPTEHVVALDCDDHRTERVEARQLLSVGAYLGRGRVRYVAEVRRARGLTDISSGFPGYATHSRAVSVLAGVSYRRR